MTQRLSVALVYGGPSGEHEISLRSAASVLTHLSKEKYQVIPIGINKKGQCFYNPLESLNGYADSLPVQTPAAEPLPALINQGKFVLQADVVFPVVHGPLLEDGALQGILELAQIAYVGCNVLSSAICMDKDVSRQLVSRLGVKYAKYETLNIHASPQTKQALREKLLQTYSFPLFVKPCCMGSSVGISKVHNESELDAAIQTAFHYDTSILIEESVVGREIELAVLENEQPGMPPKVSVPGELKITHSDGFYSYIAKYIDSDQTELVIPASLESKLIEKLQTQAAAIFSALKCSGMARVDFFVDEASGCIYFNEINTLPGFTAISMYPRAWEQSGLPYSQLLDTLITLACSNFQTKQQLVRDFS